MNGGAFFADVPHGFADDCPASRRGSVMTFVILNSLRLSRSVHDMRTFFHFFIFVIISIQYR